MIASLAGRVSAHTASGVVVSVGGVGLSVHTTPSTKARLRLGDDAALATSLVVREDALTLYGFETEDEREVFEVLQTASGVGPKVAQAVLAVHTPDAVRRALATEDLTALTLVPGIGRKGAQRMVLELKDKVAVATSAPETLSYASGSNPRRDQVVEALVGLGFTARPAEAAVDAVLSTDADADAAVLLRSALTRLGGSR